MLNLHSSSLQVVIPDLMGEKATAADPEREAVHAWVENEAVHQERTHAILQLHACLLYESCVDCESLRLRVQIERWEGLCRGKPRVKHAQSVTA